MFEAMRTAWAFGLVAALGGFFLWHFLLIQKHGRISVGEPNKYILWGEIVASGGLILLGLERLITFLVHIK